MVTLPNLYLITNPVKVISSNGTIISAEVSLGYDIARTKIEEGLLDAAVQLGLEDSFVRVIELGDFSVTYQIAGFLKDVKHLISKKSALKKYVLDCLHKRNIEIVSPSFMNQRRFVDGYQVIPKTWNKDNDSIRLEQDAEDIIFEKAEMAETIERLKEKKEKYLLELAEKRGDEKKKLERRIELLEKIINEKVKNQDIG